jgi:recombinational DNA repair protein (RecF pathway)
VFISDQGCLLRKTASGENHFLLVFFLRENGLKYVLARKPGRSNSGPCVPDLFEVGNLILEQKNPAKPAFLKDFSSTGEHAGIGKTYRQLQAASNLTRFFEKNLIHMEHYPEAWDLLENALTALAAKPNPEAILLKTYFVFARSEGYPVLAHWLESKPQGEQQSISQVLKSPAEEISATVDELNAWIVNLSLFFKRETDLLPPEDAG